MLGTLSPRPRHDDRPDDTPRQFVFADGHGGVEKIRIDLEAPHLEHVREALDTNPDASRVAVRGVPAATVPAAVRAPDEPAWPVALDRALGHVVDMGSDLGDDLDEEFIELDDPDGLLAAPGSTPARPIGRGPDLLDDEDLDLLGDVDGGVEPGVAPGASGLQEDDAAGNGQAGGAAHRVRAAGEAVR